MQKLGRRKIRFKVAVLAFMIVGNLGSVMAQTVSPSAVADTTRFETFIRDYAAASHFNGSTRVEEDGKSLFNGSFGTADRAFNVPCNDGTRYKIASITKVFTAVLVLQLAEEKKIDLDQPIKHYLSSYSGEGADTVAVRMLLNHTSGLPNADADCNSVA